jgi:hypothetical protein
MSLYFPPLSQILKSLWAQWVRHHDHVAEAQGFR